MFSVRLADGMNMGSAVIEIDDPCRFEFFNAELDLIPEKNILTNVTVNALIQMIPREVRIFSLSFRFGC